MFVGETAGQIFDGFAGFRVGQVYELHFTRAGHQVAIELEHGSPGAGPLVVSAEQFAKWWVRK